MQLLSYSNNYKKFILYLIGLIVFCQYPKKYSIRITLLVVFLGLVFLQKKKTTKTKFQKKSK